MQEFFGNGIVLDCDPRNDLDNTVYIFTKNFGRVTAKAKSTRKITSKLSGHLEAGNFVDARFIEKGNFQVVDALKISKSKVNTRDLYFLNRLLAELVPEIQIWDLLVNERFNWPDALRILGWDSEGANCLQCGKKINGVGGYFHLKGQEFFCRICASKMFQNELIYLGT